ncbi:MAG: asparagine synthase (glutamine-hydrolyzing) [Chloroflexota bacterium]
MCGITGLVDFNSDKQTAENYLRPMTDVIHHRGPDSHGRFTSERGDCGLGFCRLAIIDLSPAGNQPMRTADGRYTIVFNGEIYNHTSIREELIKLGYEYHSKTDTETILNGYIEWGEKILDKLLGMWSFALWDERKKELFAARDRIGIKPFYYHYEGGRFIFGSEIKSILKHPSVSAKMNFAELPNYLNYGMSSRAATLFEGVKKMPAGSYLRLNSNGDLKIKSFWSPINPELDNSQLTEKEIFERILTLLRQSIKDRMMSDVPFGVFLSGGIDSSVNVALMSELMTRPVDTFTVGFKELEKYNELEYARKIANLFKTNHKEILIEERQAFDVLETLPWHEDEPNADPVCIPLYFLSKLTRDSGTIVVQVGEGSDEQFAGYKWMLRDINFNNKYFKKFSALPKPLRSLAYAGAKPIISASGQHLALDYLRRGARGEQLYWSGVSIIPPAAQSKLLGRNYHHLLGIPAAYAEEIHAEALAQKPDADFLQRILYIELKQRLAELLLMRVDKMTMAHSIEARVPFLDHRFVEFTMSLSERQKLPDGKTPKYLLKKAVEGLLPDEIIYRKKMGFAAPVKEWLRAQWKDYAYDAITSSVLTKSGVLEQSYINYLFERHAAGKNNYGNEIYSLLMLALWHKNYF